MTDTACSICLDDLASLPRSKHPGCEHEFHTVCLDRWLSERSSAGCPVCRSGACPPPRRPPLGSAPTWILEVTVEGDMHMRCPRTGRIVEGLGVDLERVSFAPGESWLDLARVRYPGAYSADLRAQQAEAMAIIYLSRILSPESANIAVDLVA